AAGIVELANAHMIGAMRLVSVQRGYDPRQFVLVAFGGAGPLHANALARELGIPAVLVPPNPGIASAVGMLMTDLRHEFVTTRRLRLDALTPATLETLFAEFLKEGTARLDCDGVPAADRRNAIAIQPRRAFLQELGEQRLQRRRRERVQAQAAGGNELVAQIRHQHADSGRDAWVRRHQHRGNAEFA